MFRPLRLLGSIALGSLFACGPGADEPSTVQGSSAAENRTTLSRSALALEFADTYDVAGAPPKGVQTLTLAPEGTYVATLGDGTREQGTWTSAVGSQLPVTIYLKSGENLSTAQVRALDGTLTISRDGQSMVAKSEHTVGPSESLCDGTGGSWTDDDVDPETGLNCVCKTGMAYVPSHGGCIVLN